MNALSLFRRLLIVFFIMSYLPICGQDHKWNVTIEDPELDTTTLYDHPWIGKYHYRILKKSMRVDCRIPDGFHSVREWNGFDGYSKLKEIVGGGGCMLASDDGECIAIVKIFEPTTSEDERYIAHMRHYSPDDPLRVLDMQHIWPIKGSIIRALGYGYNYFLQGKDCVDWRCYLEYYPKKRAKRIFNADTVIRVSLNLLPGEVYGYQGKYDYLDMLVLQKMNRGYLQLFVMTTEKGKRRLPYYWRRIETIFQYQE